MKTYEMFTLFSPNLDDAKLDKAIKDLEALLGKFNGKILDADKKGRKKLAYKIDDNRDANQVILKLELEEDSVSKIRKQLSISDNILRFSILSLDESAVQ